MQAGSVTCTPLQVLILFLLVTAPLAAALAQEASAATITADAINSADLSTLPAGPPSPGRGNGIGHPPPPPPAVPDPAIVRLQVLLDRAGASPGVIDGFDGDNVRKAIWAYQAMNGLPADGMLTPEMLSAMDSGEPVVGAYEITPEDVAAITAPTPRTMPRRPRWNSSAMPASAKSWPSGFIWMRIC